MSASGVFKSFTSFFSCSFCICILLFTLWWALFLSMNALLKKLRAESIRPPPLTLREAGFACYPLRLPLSTTSAVMAELKCLRAVSLSCNDKACTWGQSNPCMRSFPFSWSLLLSQNKNRYRGGIKTLRCPLRLIRSTRFPVSPVLSRSCLEVSFLQILLSWSWSSSPLS